MTVIQATVPLPVQYKALLNVRIGDCVQVLSTLVAKCGLEIRIPLLLDPIFTILLCSWNLYSFLGIGDLEYLWFLDMSC